MKCVLEGVVVNQVSQKDVEQKDEKTGAKIGRFVTYRNVDIFMGSDPSDPFSQAKAISAKPADTSEGLAAFNYLHKKEGQKVNLLGDYTPARTVKGNSFPEKFVIHGVVESLKMVDIKPLKAAA